MQHATCTLPDCAKPHEAKGYCGTHYQRWLRTGDPYPRCRTCGTVVSSSKRHYCSDDCKPRCSVDGCESPQRKMGWCAAHYANHQQGREVKPFAYKWAGKGQPCQVCGEPTGSFRSRKYCSEACSQVASRMRRPPRPSPTPSGRPESFTCRLCGKSTPLMGRRNGKRLQRSDTVWCRDCGRESPDALRFKKYGVTPERFAEMTANGCHICGATDRRYHIDHDHACCPGNKRSCGRCVRGVLCGQCNQALGMMRDRIDLLEKAIEYLNGGVRS